MLFICEDEQQICEELFAGEKHPNQNSQSGYPCGIKLYFLICPQVTQQKIIYCSARRLLITKKIK